MSRVVLSYRGPAVSVDVPERFPIALAERKKAAKVLDKAVAERRATPKGLTAKAEADMRKAATESSAPKLIERSVPGSLRLKSGALVLTADEVKYLTDHRADLFVRCHVHRGADTAQNAVRRLRRAKPRTAAEVRSDRLSRRLAARGEAGAPADAPKGPKSSGGGKRRGRGGDSGEG